MRGFRQQRRGVVLRGGEWSKRQIQAFSWRPSSLLSLGPAGELEGPGNRLGTTSCRAPETSLRPSTSPVPGLEAAVNHSPFPSLRLTAWVALSEAWSAPFGWPEETEDQLSWAPGSLRNDGSAGCGNPGPKGAANCDPPSFSQDWDLGGWKLCLKTLPFFVSTENKSYVVEIHNNIITWPLPHHDLTSTAKDLTPKSSQQLTTTLPHLLLLKGFAESFQ